jgi:hypothetical protein
MLKIKDLDSYDYLFDLDFTGFFAAKKTNSSIPYLLEKLLIFIAVCFCPCCIARKRN